MENLKIESNQKISAVDRRPRLLFTRTLRFGSTGKDVALLQELLNKDPFTHTDPQKLWSSGHMHDFYGNHTVSAVKRFQKKYEIFSINDEEYGTMEKKTIKKLRGLFGNGSFYLQDKNRLPIDIDKIKLSELQNISLGCGPYIDRVVKVFLSIFRYYFKGKPVFSKREYAFGSYLSLSFPKARKSPLLRLFKEACISEFESVEILIKNGNDQHMSDVDMESLIMGLKKSQKSLIIIVTTDNMDGFDGTTMIRRLFSAYEENYIIILPLGELDIVKLENWVAKGNINACLLNLAIISRKILLLMETNMEYVRSTKERFQDSFIEERLDRLGDGINGQLRTIIKKLDFLMTFIVAFGEIKEACEMTRISRKTFYNWINKDSAFRNIIKS